MHLLVDLDGIDFIDCLKLHESRFDYESMCSWCITYIHLLEKPISIPAGSRISWHCTVNLEDEALATYFAVVDAGEVDSEREVASVK